MPRPIRKHSIAELVQSYTQIGQLDAKSAVFYADCVQMVMFEMGEEFGLNIREVQQVAQLLNMYLFGSILPKTQVGIMLGRGGKNYHDPIPDRLKRFFFLGPKGYALSGEGELLLSWWETTLRRVLTDREEFYRLKFGRFTKAEQLKRRLKKRFYKDLTEAEQIAVLRTYWALPYRNDDEKRVRKRMQIELRVKYDLTMWDITNAVLKFGDVVKSIRLRPDMVGLFPVYTKKRS